MSKRFRAARVWGNKRDLYDNELTVKFIKDGDAQEVESIAEELEKVKERLPDVQSVREEIAKLREGA
jgi:hypothetical protein